MLHIYIYCSYPWLYVHNENNKGVTIIRFLVCTMNIITEEQSVIIKLRKLDGGFGRYGYMLGAVVMVIFNSYPFCVNVIWIIRYCSKR